MDINIHKVQTIELGEIREVGSYSNCYVRDLTIRSVDGDVTVTVYTEREESIKVQS